jgi:hypothetical protein
MLYHATNVLYRCTLHIHWHNYISITSPLQKQGLSITLLTNTNKALANTSWIITSNEPINPEHTNYISVESKGNNDVTICKRCRDYEIQLNKALNELISIWMVNELLWKELLSYASPKRTWGIDIDSSDNNGNPLLIANGH